MAKNRVSKYTIELDIEQGDETRRTVDDIEKSLKAITDSAKSGDLSKGLADAKTQAKALSDQIKEIASSEKDSTQEIEAYSKAATKAIADLEKQSTLITYSLSDQGKEQRARIAELKQELSVLGQTKEEKQKAKEIQKELKQLQKDVLDYSDADLKKALDANRATRATLKMAQQEAKLKQAEMKSHKTLGQLVKADLKGLQEKIKAQFKFIDALKTTEGRYNLIKKAAEKAGKAGLSLGKGALKAGGAVIGGALALGGAAIASANSQVDREREVNRIKGGLSDDEKNEILGSLYVQTGADYTSIVDAINRVQTVLGGNIGKDELVEATTAEIKMPGAAALLKQQNTAPVTSKDFTAYFNRMKSMQSLTGATTEQITSSSDYIANLRQSSFSNASQADLQTLYLALQNSGAFDSEEELQRAFKSFVRTQKDSGEDVFKLAQQWQENGKWAKTAYGATNKTQVLNTIGNLDFKGMGQASRITDYSAPQETDAEKTARQMRELEETKNKILVKMLSAIAPIIEKIDVKELEKIFDSAFRFFEKVTPPLLDFINKAVGFFGWAMENLLSLPDKVSNFFSGEPQVQGAGMLVTDNGDGTATITTSSNALSPRGWGSGERGVSGYARANGGLAAIPSICGESGAEMVVPLDPSRETRGRELTQNLTQYFNMSGNETTTLSLSQAVKSRDFTRAMMNNNYLNGRLGR